MSRLNRKAAQEINNFLGDKNPLSISELQRLEGCPIGKDEWVPGDFQNERNFIRKTMITANIIVYFIPRKGLNADFPLFIKEIKKGK